MTFEEGRRKRLSDLASAILGCHHPDLSCGVFSDAEAKKIAYAVQELISINFLAHMADMHVPTDKPEGGPRGQ